MAKMKELLKQIVSIVSDVEGVDINKINSAIAEATELHNVQIERNKELAEEAKTKRNRINELKSELETVTEKTSQYSDYDELKNKLNSFEEERMNSLRTKWTEEAKCFDVKEDDPNFSKISKVKSKFNFDENLTEEQINKNLELLEVFKEMDFFESPKTTDPVPNSKPNASVNELKTESDILASLEQGLQS